MNKGKIPENLNPITKRFLINQNVHLGKGCFGNVYEGYDHETGKIIAIKHLNRPENFKDQVQTLEKLSTLTHPNIMGFYGYKADQDDVYLFIEYCPNGTLTKLIKKGLDEERVLDLLRQLVQGMCYMNAKGIMHRDLKPDNILIGVNEDIKISDFGLARFQDGLQKTGQMGTPLYAGPEIYTNYTDAYNFNCDVWSAGMILHEMLTGNHPLEHIKSLSDLKNEWKMFEKGEKRIVYPKNIHPQWQYITNIMLTYNFKKRPMFHDILELLKKLDENGTMRKQIINAKKGIKVQQNEKQVNLQKYLSFIQQKSDVVIELTKLTPQNFPYIRASLQEMLTFLSMTWYVINLKNLIRSLKFKNLKYPDKNDVLERNKPDEQIDLILDKYRNQLDVKLTKYQNYLKEKVIPNLNEFETKPEEMKIFKNIDSAYKLFTEAKEGTYDVKETYEQQFIKLLSFYKIKPTEQKIKEMNINQLRIYALILTVGFLNQEFPIQKYTQKDFVQKKLKALNSFDAAQLRAQITRLRNRLH